MNKLPVNHTVNLPKGLCCLLIFLIVAISGFSQNAGICQTGAIAMNAPAGLNVNNSLVFSLLSLTSSANTTHLIPLFLMAVKNVKSQWDQIILHNRAVRELFLKLNSHNILNSVLVPIS